MYRERRISGNTPSRDRFRWTSIHLITVLLLVVLIMDLMSLPVPALQDTDPGVSNAPHPSIADGPRTTDPLRMPLYLAGISSLSPAPPADTPGQTTSFRSGIGISFIEIGIWRSRPLEADLAVEGDAKVSLWARGNGVQSSAQFRLTLGVDDQFENGVIQTQTMALSGGVKEYVGEISTSFNLSRGQYISLRVEVRERGSGGEIVFGSSAHPSHVSLGAEPVRTATYADEHEAGEYVVVRTTVEDVWGPEDIVSVNQFIVGPFEKRQLDFDPDSVSPDMIIATSREAERDQGDVIPSGMNITWRWSYEGWMAEGQEVEPGIYYLVGVVAATGDRTYSDTGTVVIPEEPPGPLEGPGGTILGAVLIGVAAVGIYFYALRTDRIVTDRGRTVAAGLMIAVIVISGFYVFMTAIPMTSSSSTREAPDFTVERVEGGSFSLSDHRGKVVLIDLFATWCPGCQAEMSTLVRLQKNYEDVVFVSVSVEGSGDTEEDIKAFKERYGAGWAFTKDTDRVWQRYQDLSRPYIPTIVIVDGEGHMTFRDIGEVPYDALSQEIDRARRGGVEVTITAQEASLYMVAFVTGVLSFFAPCAFPLLPGYMSYYLSRQEKEESSTAGRRMLRYSTGGFYAALGVLVIFSMAGLLVAAVGSAVVAYVNYLTPIIAIVIAFMGLLMLLDRTAWTERLLKFFSPMVTRLRTVIAPLSDERARTGGGNLGLFAYGAGYGVASMGCQAPVFVAIIVAGFAAGGFMNALLVFLTFGIGMGLMMVMVTVLVGMAKGAAIEKMTRAMPYIKRASGLILLLAGIYLAWYYLDILL